MPDAARLRWCFTVGDLAVTTTGGGASFVNSCALSVNTEGGQLRAIAGQCAKSGYNGEKMANKATFTFVTGCVYDKLGNVCDSCCYKT